MTKDYYPDTEAERPSTRELVRDLNLMDDIFFSTAVNGRTAFLQLVLDVVLAGRRKEVVHTVHTQHKVSNHNKHVIYDTYAETESGTRIILEVQNKPQDFTARRLRFYLSALDCSVLRRGEEYDSLPDVIFILIMPEDVFHKGAPVYFVPEDLEVEGSIIRDGVLRIFIDSRRNTDDTALGHLMHDFTSSDPEKMYYTVIRETVGDFIDSEGERHMTERLEREFEIREARGEARGRVEEKKSNILGLLKETSLSDSEISRALNVPEKEVSALRLSAAL